MNYEELKELIQAGESYHTEFKHSLDKTFIEEACAFANSGGGRILLGVSDQGEIKGSKTDNVMRSRVQDTLRQLDPRIDCQVNLIQDVIEVYVPEGADKPYGCSKGFFMRMGANSQKLSRNEIIEFFQKEGRIRFGELRHPRADFEQDFDPAAFKDFLRLSGISPSLDRNTLLRNLNCLTHDNQLTNAGVLFFARDIDFILNHAIVVCALYKGNIKVDILDRKNFKGNLVDNIDNALLFVQRHTNEAIIIQSTQHTKVPDYPEVALREAIINAVCHRDYFFQSSHVMVEIYENRVEICNPGGLPTSLKPEEFGTKSVPRNPLIASLLHRINYIEKMGTGIERIRKAVEQHSGCTVEFKYDDFYTVIFRLKEPEKSVRTRSERVNDGGQEKEGRLVEKLGENDMIFTLSDKSKSKDELLSILHKTVGGRLVEKVGSRLAENQIKILVLLKHQPSMSKKRLAEITSISTTAIDKNIIKLKSLNLLKRVGPDKGGFWEVIDK